MADRKKVINYAEVEKYASVFCTEEEIAALFEQDIEKLKLKKEFRRVYDKAFANAKLALREFQFEAARKGNFTILTLLGKCYLGQKESVGENTRLPDYDLTQLPEFFLDRIINGENSLKVISEYEALRNN